MKTLLRNLTNLRHNCSVPRLLWTKWTPTLYLWDPSSFISNMSRYINISTAKRPCLLNNHISDIRNILIGNLAEDGWVKQDPREMRKEKYVMFGLIIHGSNIDQLYSVFIDQYWSQVIRTLVCCSSSPHSTKSFNIK